MLRSFNLIGMFFWHYLATRPWWKLLLATPILLIPAILILLKANGPNDKALLQKYQRAFHKAVDHDDVDQAWTLARMSVELAPGSTDAKFQLAEAMDLRGDSAAAASLMRKLANDGDAPYLPAHQWLADELLARAEQYGKLSTAEIQQLIHHLHATGKQDDPKVNYQLGKLYLAIGEATLANSYLMESNIAEANFDLARLALSQGNRKAATEYARTAKKQFEVRARRQPTVLRHRVMWAQSCILLDDLNQAFQLLREASGLEGLSETDQQTLADSYLLLSQACLQRSRLDIQRAALAYQQAIQLAQPNAEILQWGITLIENRAQLPAETIEFLKSRIDARIEAEEEEPVWLSLKSRLLGLTKGWEAAVAVLKPSIQQYPQLNRQLAALYFDHGETTAAARHATAFIELLERNDRADWTNADHLTYAECLCFTRKFDQARSHIAGHVTAPRQATALQRTWLLQAQSVQESDWEQRHDLLISAHNAFPTSQAAIQRLAVDLEKDDDSADSARAALYQILAGGHHSLLVHTLLGNDAARHQNWERSQQHYEAALQLRPEEPLVLNNLAYCLIQQDEKELIRAKSLIDRANSLVPDHPEIISTRGRIQYHSEQYLQAISDLEFARRHFPQRKDLIEYLVKSYEAIGNTEAAEALRERLADA